MSHKNKRCRSLSFLEASLILLLIMVIGPIGWYVWHQAAIARTKIAQGKS